MGRIYTRKGDKGNTKTFRGAMSKSDELAEALGTVDELNSWLGLILNLKFEILNQFEIKQIKSIQTNLMRINAKLAGSGNSSLKLRSYEVTKLEKWIDKMTGELPKLTNFIYPVGEIQVARAVCRRAERRVVSYQLSVNNKLDSYVVKYLNRLSDYLFTLARWVNFKNGVKEEVWN